MHLWLNGVLGLCEGVVVNLSKLWKIFAKDDFATVLSNDQFATVQLNQDLSGHRVVPELSYIDFTTI